MGCNPKFDAVLSKMADIHDKKSEDYASVENRYSNFEAAARVTALFADPLDQVFAALIGVKLARLGELRSSGKTPNHESIQDTRIDLANYAALWASYYEPTKAIHNCGTDVWSGATPPSTFIPYINTRALLDTRSAGSLLVASERFTSR